MSRIIQLALRGLQFFWTLLIIALVGNMIHDAIGGNPPIVNFIMFLAVFSMLSLLYQIAHTYNKSFVGHDIIPVVLDALNVLLFFAAAVALAAYLKVNNCADQSYVDNNFVTNGSYDNTKRCRESQASCAFLWFAFAAYAASLFFSISESSGTNINLRSGLGGIRRGGTSSNMSQV